MSDGERFPLNIPIPANLEDRYREAATSLLANRPMQGWGNADDRTPPLSAGEIAALRKVGLSIKPWTGGDARDPLTRTVIDYSVLLGSSLIVSDAARLLGVNPSRVRQKIEEGALFGIREGSQWRLPAFQFEGKRTLPGLKEVLAALPQDLNPLDFTEWFLAPNPDLEAEDLKNKGTRRALSPRTWLLRGLPARPIANLLKHL